MIFPLSMVIFDSYCILTATHWFSKTSPRTAWTTYLVEFRWAIWSSCSGLWHYPVYSPYISYHTTCTKPMTIILFGWWFFEYLFFSIHLGIYHHPTWWLLIFFRGVGFKPLTRWDILISYKIYIYIYIWEFHHPNDHQPVVTTRNRWHVPTTRRGAKWSWPWSVENCSRRLAGLDRRYPFPLGWLINRGVWYGLVTPK